MMLTQLDTVKRRLNLNLGTDIQDDDIITNAIKAVSARSEQHCNRRWERTVAATYEFDAQDREILVDRAPIESVTKFELKTTETEGWVEQTGIDYLIRRACIVSLMAPLATLVALGRVTFTGGYVLPGTDAGAGQTALPDDLEQACVEQVVYWYQRKDQLGLVSISGQGGSIQQFAQLNLLPNVKDVFESYRRFQL